jgi:hypothetical protein
MENEMNAVVKVEEAADSMMAMIERASRDPSVDVDKMRQLFALRKELLDEENKRLFNAAMNAAQAEMTPVAVNMTNPQTRSRYASYDQLDRAIRPIYTKHGFSISYDQGDTPLPEHIRVLAYVAHSSGYERTYRTDMPTDGKGAKGGEVMTKTHAVGAGKSYGKRYILRDVFNLAIGEEDKDGNAEKEHIGPGQVADIRALLSEVNASEESFLRVIKAKSIESIHVESYSTVIGILEAKRKQ